MPPEDADEFEEAWSLLRPAPPSKKARKPRARKPKAAPVAEPTLIPIPTPPAARGVQFSLGLEELRGDGQFLNLSEDHTYYQPFIPLIATGRLHAEGIRFTFRQGCAPTHFTIYIDGTHWIRVPFRSIEPVQSGGEMNVSIDVVLNFPAPVSDNAIVPARTSFFRSLWRSVLNFFYRLDDA